MKDYHINIFYSVPDEGYIADIPDLTHCLAFGETPEAALAEVLLAKAAWLDAARAEGKPIPPPTFRPASYLPPKSKTRTPPIPYKGNFPLTPEFLEENDR